MQQYIIYMIGWLYSIIVVLMSLFSANMLLLTVIYWIFGRKWKKKQPVGVCDLPYWPVVTLQLPLFNEKQVAGRLIDAIACLDYPWDKMQIQVLDDSTDDTQELVQSRADYWCSQGRWVEVVHRVDRRDYKAGALKEGLETAAGDYIAIFDADFIPPADWLKNAIRPFCNPGNEKLGLVQTRWSHLNDNYSMLTRAQALALDAHFGIEQNVRSHTGFFMNFNGTAGIWRKDCIKDAGNWRGTTLSEDLDLSYRAQLRGWKVHFLVDVTAPAELPTLMIGFKRQQFRWSKGSIQAARLLVPQILTSRISPLKKLESVVHITGYIAHPLMIALLLLTLPMILWGENIARHMPLTRLGFLGLALPLFYATSQVTLYGPKKLWQWLVRMPVLAALGVGIAINNSRAIWEGLSGKQSAFERTPKTGVLRRKRGPHNVVTERFRIDSSTWFELVFGIYSLMISIIAGRQGNWLGAFFFSLYAAGFVWVATATLREARATSKVV